MVGSIREAAVKPILRGLTTPALRQRHASRYMNQTRREFGAFTVLDTADKSKVKFSIFFPGSSLFEPHPEIPGYGKPNIRSIHVIGPFQTDIGQQKGETTDDNEMRPANHPSGKGIVWEWTTPIELSTGFYEYRYAVVFDDGSYREVCDPCARWGGDDPANSGVVVGCSPLDDVVPLARRLSYRELIVYELNIDDFTAELPGATPPIEKVRARVRYLQDLGVNAVLFMPWTAWSSPDFSWGYTPTSYFAVEHRYTHNYADKTEDAWQRSRLKRLISELHAADIHVIMDGVFNHVGPDTACNRGFSYRQLYQNRDACPFVGTFGGAFPGLLDLDYNNACTRELIQDVCFYWMDEFDIDGIRYDNAINMVVANLSYGLPDLLEAVDAHAREIDKENGARFSQTIEYLDISAAQVTNATAATSYWRNSLYQDCFEYLWKGTMTGRIMTSLDAKAYLTAPNKVATTYLGNHDHSGFAWQAGANVAQPDKSCNAGSALWFRTQPYAIALLMAPGTPMIASGQECGLDHWIPEDDQGSSRRIVPRPFHWSYVDDKFGAPLLRLYRKLIDIRKRFPALCSDDIYPAAWPEEKGSFDEGYGIDTSRRLMIFHRWGPGRRGTDYFIIALNFSDCPQQVDIPLPKNGIWTDLLAYPPELVKVDSFMLTGWTVPSHYGCIFHITA